MVGWLVGWFGLARVVRWCVVPLVYWLVLCFFDLLVGLLVNLVSLVWLVGLVWIMWSAGLLFR